MAFALSILPCFSLAELVADGLSSPLEFASNDVLPENADIFPPLPWEDDMEFSIPSTDNPQANIDLKEAPVFPTEVFVADSNLDTLQSGCGPKDDWAAGKLRARDGLCHNKAPTPLRLDPNVFDSVLLSPGSGPEAFSVTSVLSEESQKCTPPYIYNLCCSSAPSGFSGAEGFF